MLQLTNMKKDYRMADTVVHALRGITITFRDNEFVSILGPSGCGKTTLLNIIGGLDHGTDGDLTIDGISTKKYTDRDWDTYRNHRIGFIFQSYNLIPHQTILQNVELALTIAGMDKETRTKKAKSALDKVGLEGLYHKKPNQLSGGQCQRVAIARALVNEPEILLADEPTGALDTKTSVQIMDLIREIAKEKLVIMVTHNPDLAEKYSTRIVRLLDGQLVSDSHPYEENEEKVVPQEKEEKKSKLSLWTAFKLSAQNLRSKFKRTAMVCVAGSIGIIGVATVLAVSNGVQGYIRSMQDDMLSGNPIQINEETMDLSMMMSATSDAAKKEALKLSVEDGKVNVDFLLEYLIEQSNNMASFRVKNDINEDLLHYIDEMPEEYYSAIAKYYGIDISNNIYTSTNFEGQPANHKMSLRAIRQTYTAMMKETEFKDYAGYITALVDPMQQSMEASDFILSQYDIVSNPETSHIAEKENEVMLVVNSETEVTDLLLGQLGYYTQKEFFNIVYRASNDERYDESLDKVRFTYDELMEKEFTWFPNNTIFTRGINDTNPFSYEAYQQSDWKDGISLKVTAILRPKKDISYGCLQSGFYYTPALTKKILQDSLSSEIVQYLVEHEMDGFSSMSYKVSDNITMNTGITYKYDYTFEGVEKKGVTGFVGEQNVFSQLIGTQMGQDLPEVYTLSIRALGGEQLPNQLSIYPVDFEIKDQVTKYLDQWNKEGDLVVGDTTIKEENRSRLVYNDNLSIVIGMISTMIDIVTAALVSFTALSLVVSTVMIAIITYVSVMERIKEIGVIRSLGGRKKDVAHLFNAETIIIGGISGIFGVGITYGLSGIINLVIGSLTGIYTLASLPILAAILLIAISILLTSISGLIPASLAAKKDPVEALRSE